MTDTPRWWSPMDVPEGAEREVVLGPLRVRIARANGLLRIAHHSDDDEEAELEQVGAPREQQPIEEGWSVQRFAGVPVDAMVRLRPVTPSRPVVSRPEVPLVVMPGSQLDVYVSTPVWVAVEAPALLTELPVRVPKPTFFGSPSSGVSAYAMPTLMRVDLANVQPRHTAPSRRSASSTPAKIHCSSSGC